jgi:uncharacterized protein (TIGR00369 family)
VDDDIPEPPEGFVRSERRGAFSIHNGPYFHREGEDETVEQAFYALPRHANGLGLVHGGMLSAFLDGVRAGAVWRKTQTTGVTIHLAVNFLHMARLGDWVMGEARVTRAVGELVFVEGRAFVRSTDVARATGIFKLMGRPR